METRLRGITLRKARTMLYDIVDFLNTQGIDYHLEGGTLLGLARDGELIEWDFDLDLSVDEGSAEKFLKKRYLLWLKGYRVTSRKSKISYGPISRGDIRMLKVKSIFSSVAAILSRAARQNLLVADIFVKFKNGEDAYWIAKKRVMKVSAIHYSGYDTIMYRGVGYKVPLDYPGYLTSKYGDWSVPVREWNCAKDEKTVITGVTHWG
ncbi:MAG: LicD family protein [Bacteroidales bacterium]|nr:LicD family protein [Bacteroidales bacterium]